MSPLFLLSILIVTAAAAVVFYLATIRVVLGTDARPAPVALPFVAPIAAWRAGSRWLPIALLFSVALYLGVACVAVWA